MAGRFLGVSAANLIGAFNIHQIVLSGRVDVLGSLFLDAVNDEMVQRVLPAMAEATDVTYSSLGDDIVLVARRRWCCNRSWGLSDVRIGLDIYVIKMAAMLVDSRGRPVVEMTQATNVAGSALLLAGTVDLVDRLLQAAGETRASIEAIGAGVSGLIDVEAGTVQLAVNLNLTSAFPSADALSAELGAPVTLENDVRTAALGVYRWVNESSSTRSVAYPSIGPALPPALCSTGPSTAARMGWPGRLAIYPLS